MTTRLSTVAAAFALSLAASSAFAQSYTAPAGFSFGSNAAQAVQDRARIPTDVHGVYVSDDRGGAYKDTGTHAGGPANSLRRNTAVRPVEHRVSGRAYRYSGTHAGGPANDVPRR